MFRFVIAEENECSFRLPRHLGRSLELIVVQLVAGISLILDCCLLLMEGRLMVEGDLLGAGGVGVGVGLMGVLGPGHEGLG